MTYKELLKKPLKRMIVIDENLTNEIWQANTAPTSVELSNYNDMVNLHIRLRIAIMLLNEVIDTETR